MVQLSKLGKRVVCDECGTKYYDLNRDKAICPRCGGEKTRIKELQEENAVPIAIEVDEDDDIKSDEMDLEPLDDLELNEDDKKKEAAEEEEIMEEEIDKDDLPIGTADDPDD